jgi:hypothetical protein
MERNEATPMTEAERLAQALEPIIKHARETVEFEAAGCPIDDPYDTFPPDLYQAATRASHMLRLLTEIAAELRRLSADAQRLDRLLSHHTTLDNGGLFMWFRTPPAFIAAGLDPRESVRAAIDQAMDGK